MLNPAVADKPAPIPQAVAELWELVVAYFKQETTEPLKNLGRVVGFGLAGSLLLGIGVMFVAIGALRFLQHDLADTFDGNWSFAPYLIVIVLLLVTAALVFTLGTRTKAPTTPSHPEPASATSATWTPPTPAAVPTPTPPVRPMKDVRP